MSARERLIELLKQKSCMFVACDEECDGCGNAEMYESEIESIADHLIDKGVIVPPCKVGDTVYVVEGVYPKPYVKEKEIGCIMIKGTNDFSKQFWEDVYGGVIGNFADFGKTVFLTREEAENALAERRKE